MNKDKLKDVTKEELLKYVNDHWSYESIGALYGVSGSSIRKKLKKLGVILPKRRSINKTETFNKGVKFTAQNYCINCGRPIQNNYKYCSNSCKNEYENKLRIDHWLNHPEDFSTEKFPDFIKRYLFDIYQGCQVCGWHEINPYTGKIPLQIHHIDGNCLNNDINNLQLLCPNCHSLTNNFGALNKTGSKRYKYKYYRQLYNKPL